MKIEKNKVVSIHYTLKDENGKQLDSSIGAEPLTYYHGNGYLIVGLEKELEGKSTGDKFSCVIKPEEGYGIHDERLIAIIPRERFEMDGEIEIGMQFQVQTPAGPTIVHVIGVDKNEITVDGNHDLAGKTLYFDIEVTDVHEPSEEEKQQFEAVLNGGCGGCGGGCGGCGNNCSSDCNGDCNVDCNNGDGNRSCKNNE